VAFAVVTDSAGTEALRLTRGPLPPVLLRFVGRSPDGWVFTDGRARYTFASGRAGGSAPSPAVWADLGVSLVRWERAP
jgi:hypothetical protein